MLANLSLSNGQLQAFKANGSLIARNLLNAEQMTIISRWFDGRSMCSEFSPSPSSLLQT